MLRFGCVLAGEKRASCLGLVVFLLGKECCLLRSGCVLAGEERAGYLGLIVFLLGDRELIAYVSLCAFCRKARESVA